jgi:hypothetical protein
MKTITTSVQLKIKISGHGCQGAWRQDELIGGKPPVAKLTLTLTWLITVAARSKASIVFARSDTGIVGLNPTQGMDVCLCLICVGSGLSPVQGVLPTALGWRNWSETRHFTDALCSKVGATGKRERFRRNWVLEGLNNLQLIQGY